MQPVLNQNISPSSRTKPKIATKNDLLRINFTVLDRRFPGLKAREHATLACFIALVRLGYEKIISPLDCVIETIARGTGIDISRRTFFRALKVLEEGGFIFRETYNLARHKKITHINFINERFELWNTARPYTPQKPQQVPKRHSPTDEELFSVLDLKESVLNEQGTPVKNNRAKKTDYKNWKNPVLYSIIKILERQNRPATEKRYIEAAAAAEIAGISAGIESHSGIDWNRHNWQQMSIQEREAIARLDLIPRLEPQKEQKTIQPSQKPQVAMEVPNLQLREKIINSLRVEKSSFISSEHQKTSLHQPVLLSEQELEVLENARRRSEWRKKTD